jgi:hypothetical protein
MARGDGRLVVSSNRELLVRTVRKIEPLLERLVFVGGAVVELYFTDPASDRVRPTTDTDCLCEVASYTEYHRLGDRLEIRVPLPPVLLATKLAAHGDRGTDDPMTSADLEDVIALLANRPELVDEVKAADRELRAWTGRRVAQFLPSDRAAELVAAFLPETRQVPELRSMVTERVAALREGAG